MDLVVWLFCQWYRPCIYTMCLWCVIQYEWLSVVLGEVRSLFNKTHVVTRSFDISLADIMNFHSSCLTVSLFIFFFKSLSPYLSLTWSHRSELHIELFRLSGCDAVQRGDQQTEERVWRHPENDTGTGAGTVTLLVLFNSLNAILTFEHLITEKTKNKTGYSLRLHSFLIPNSWSLSPSRSWTRSPRPRRR